MPPRRLVISLLCLAGLAGLGAYAWRANGALERTPAATAENAAKSLPVAQKPVLVEVAAVAARTLVDDVAAVGTLVSNQSVVLHPEVAGRVAVIRFRDGGAVRRGAVLVELDAAVQRAELQQAKAELMLADANARRAEDLFAGKFVSSSTREEAASRLEVARASVALAQARLERTRIRAPFDGIVGIRKVNIGDYVRDGDALVNIEDIATLKLDFRLPELYLGRIGPGQALEVSSDVVPGVTFPATVDAIDPLVDAEGRAVLLRARLANDKGRLRPGVFARVKVLVDRRDDVLLVPETALIPAPGQTQFVYRVEDGHARRVEVSTGARRAGEVEVVQGLAPGDRIVIAGQLKLRDGAPVTVAQPMAVSGVASDAVSD
ncbi:MAG: efflux RND transporter periplasmic adaptor subunit [Azoarcus sp.]|jgi:membrane fusion protein (multidrug efflux system)|nr:efflux RND transporter periplasmic adaptor subunit [Azoarcus sp.]